MFDTMTMVKAFGWLCGALLIYLLINWAGESLYAMDAGGHGEENAMGYAIEVAESGDGGEAEEDTGPSFEEVLPAQTPPRASACLASARPATSWTAPTAPARI